MTQVKFLWTSKNVPDVKVEQKDNGMTIVTLRKNIMISHNSNKRDKMQISFIKEKVSFLIPDQRALEEIYKIRHNRQTCNIRYDGSEPFCERASESHHIYNKDRLKRQEACTSKKCLA